MFRRRVSSNIPLASLHRCSFHISRSGLLTVKAFRSTEPYPQTKTLKPEILENPTQSPKSLKTPPKARNPSKKRNLRSENQQRPQAILESEEAVLQLAAHRLKEGLHHV